MTKEEQIDYWIFNSEMDWDRAIRCFNSDDYVFSLYCFNLSFEKFIKALWIKSNNENFPPKLHNLIRLIELSNLSLEEDYLIFLNDLNRFQLEGRYPDYKGRIYKECTKEFTLEMINKAKEIKICLQNLLQ